MLDKLHEVLSSFYFSFPAILNSQKIALFEQNIIKFLMQMRRINSIQWLNITTFCIQCLSCFQLRAIEQVDSNNKTSKLYLVHARLEYIYGNGVLLLYAQLHESFQANMGAENSIRPQALGSMPFPVHLAQIILTLTL